MIRFLILLAILGGIGFVTKPSDDALEEKIIADMTDAFASSSGNADEGIGEWIELGCRFAPEECARAAARGMEIETSDYVAFKLGEVRYRGESLTCAGVFTKWWCLDPGSDGA